MESLSATPRDLARLLRPVSPSDAAWRATADAWSIEQIVGHLGSAEMLLRARLQRVIAEENPLVAVLEDEVWVSSGQSLQELLEHFAAERSLTLGFLAGLSQGDWGRRLRHPSAGAMRLRDQVQFMVTHDNEHLAGVVALREQLEARTR